jgi:hypothetical protein
METTNELRDAAWLLHSMLAPFPISGDLVLDNGELSFVLTPSALTASLGWLERELGQHDLRERVEAGEQIYVFKVAVDDIDVDWPMTLRRVAMRIKTRGPGWIVSLDYPTGGAVWESVSHVRGHRRAQAWREVLDGRRAS